jgi:hypothetical protein
MKFKYLVSSNILAFFFLLLGSVIHAQEVVNKIEISKAKSKFYISWGWNRGWFTKSDFHFVGKDYDFTLYGVRAKDRQSHVSFDTYLNPKNITIPQYNFKAGYFINKHYDLSFGIDHMKYVVQQNQEVIISGNISKTGTSYDKNYSNETIKLKEDFLKLEHTDGLNYANFGLRRSDEIFNIKHLQIFISEGIEAGVLVPKTDASLLNKMRNNEWHLAGYGLALNFGINLTLFKHLYLQTEVKGGYINMPDVRTTPAAEDHAEQSFLFGQYNFLIGARF